MANLWKLSARAPKPIIHQALLAHDEIEDWDAQLVIAGREEAPDKPDDWVLEAWCPAKPGKREKAAIAALFSDAKPLIELEELPDRDWLSLSQQNAKPIRAGRFYVHTPDFEPDDEAVNFVIPAAQAFGTGQHETTAGCLEMLDAMKRSGIIARQIADIGTGTGLLGFAGLALWPGATLTATDIDPVCAPIVLGNAEANALRLGAKPGEVTMVVAEGMRHPLIEARAPYDLLIANILAGPLVELSSAFAAHTAPKGQLLLAGLLAGEQEAQVKRAYKRAGFMMQGRIQRGDWAILWMRRRAQVGSGRPSRSRPSRAHRNGG